MNEFNKFMTDSNNLMKPSTLSELNRILGSMNGTQLLFALTRIYQTVDLDGRYILKEALNIHKQRLNIETTKPSNS